MTLKEMTLKELLERRDAMQAQMDSLAVELNLLNTDIQCEVSGQLLELRRIQGKESGAVNALIQGIKVTETIPKKVEWDQDKMNELFDRIAVSGDDPRAYMKVKLEVSEKSYESFDAGIKGIFEECRTIKYGKPQLKFEKGE